MICRASSTQSPQRAVDVGDDLIEIAKRLRDEGHDPTLSLDAIIALSDSALLKSGQAEEIASNGQMWAPLWGPTRTCVVLLVFGLLSRFTCLNWPA